MADFRSPRARLKAILFLGMILGGVAGLSGCGSLNGPADLVICNSDEPQTLDPAEITGQLEGRIALSLFEGLTTRDPDGAIIPGMAQSWTISPDGLTYTFTLRPGIKWSNGEAITSNDFLKSWQRVLDPNGGYQYNYQLFYVVNAEAYATSKITDFSQVGIKAPDAQTLVVTLSKPVAFFLELTSMQTLCPVYLPNIARYPKDWTKPEKLVCNGPYLMKEWRLRDYILLEANPTYWRPVKIHRIKVLPTDNPNTAFNLFYSHKIDLILDKAGVPSILVKEIRDKPYFHSNPFGATMFVRYNVTHSVLKDVRVRQALAMAINKENIVTKITRAGEPVAQSLVPPGPFPYTLAHSPDFNPGKARALLAEAGYPEGKNFPELTLLYPAKGTSSQIAEEVQEQWKVVLGIDTIKLRGQEWKVYLNSQQTMDYDIMFSSWVGDYADPQTFLDMFETGNGNNNTGWSNARYDQLLKDSESTPDATRRMQMLHDMEVILVEQEMPIVPIYHQVGMSLFYSDKVGGFKPNFVDDHRWGELFIPEGKK